MWVVYWKKNGRAHMETFDKEGDAHEFVFKAHYFAAWVSEPEFVECYD